MVRVAGPPNGWGLSNPSLDGVGSSGIGFDVVSGSSGECRTLSLASFGDAAIREGVLASCRGLGPAHSMHNAYGNIAINIPNVAGAKGVVQTGVPNPTPAPGGTAAAFGFFPQWTDTNLYRSVHCVGGDANSACFLFDCTLQDNLPSSCTIPGLPQVVTSLDLAGPWQPFSGSQGVVPCKTGIHGTSVYLRIGDAGGTGSLVARIAANDRVGSVGLDRGPGVNAAGGAGFGPIAFRAVGGSPASYPAVFQNVPAEPTYSLTMSTERIG